MGYLLKWAIYHGHFPFPAYVYADGPRMALEIYCHRVLGCALFEAQAMGERFMAIDVTHQMIEGATRRCLYV